MKRVKKSKGVSDTTLKANEIMNELIQGYEEYIYLLEEELGAMTIVANNNGVASSLEFVTESGRLRGFITKTRHQVWNKLEKLGIEEPKINDNESNLSGFRGEE